MGVVTETKVDRSAPRALAVYAWCVLAFLLLVVLWGAFVRTSGSGGGCGASWPLCNGDFFPHHPRLATVIEFTHRSMTGICTALMLVLGVWTFYSTGRRHGARRAWVWSAVLLVTEAIFGAVLVLRGYVEQNVSTGRIVMQSIHFTNTLLLVAAVTLTAWFLSRKQPERSIPAKEMAQASSLAIAAIVATILVGATGSLAALADTLFPSTSLTEALAADFAAGSPLLVRMRWMHPAAAVLGFLFVVLLALKVRSRTSWFVMGLLVLQIVLGVGDVLLLAPTWMQVLHLLGADLYWIALVVLSGEVWLGSRSGTLPQ